MHHNMLQTCNFAIWYSNASGVWLVRQEGPGEIFFASDMDRERQHRDCHVSLRLQASCALVTCQSSHWTSLILLADVKRRGNPSTTAFCLQIRMPVSGVHAATWSLDCIGLPMSSGCPCPRGQLFTILHCETWRSRQSTMESDSVSDHPFYPLGPLQALQFFPQPSISLVAACLKANK